MLLYFKNRLIVVFFLFLWRMKMKARKQVDHKWSIRVDISEAGGWRNRYVLVFHAFRLIDWPKMQRKLLTDQDLIISAKHKQNNTFSWRFVLCWSEYFPGRHFTGNFQSLLYILLWYVNTIELFTVYFYIFPFRYFVKRDRW